MLYAEATQRARVEKKVVLVFFGATWCEPCKILWDQLHSGPMQKIVSDSLVLVKLYGHETSKNQKVANASAKEYLYRYSAGRTGLPYWVTIAPDGTKKLDGLTEPPKLDGREFEWGWARMRQIFLSMNRPDLLPEVNKLDKLFMLPARKLPPGLGGG